MENLTSKTIEVFSRPFSFPGFDETLPAGKYAIKTELCSPPGHLNPETWKASVEVKLPSRQSHSGLARTLTVSLANLNRARARDKRSGKELADFFLEEMLTDPMVRLVMQADSVSEAQLRYLYSGLCTPKSDCDVLDQKIARPTPRDRFREASAIHAAENEGMPTLAE